MMKRKSIKRMHPMARFVLETIIGFFVCILFGVAFAYAVIYFMAWICCC